MATLAVARRAGHHIQHAARSVLAIEGGTRPADQLQGGYVVQRKRDGRPLLRPEKGHRGIAAVDQRRHPAVERAVEAARVEVVVVEAALGHLGAGRELEQLGQLTVRSLALDLLLSHQGHRRGCLDDPLRAQRHRRHRDGLGEQGLPIHSHVDCPRAVRLDSDVKPRSRAFSERIGQGVGPRRDVREAVETVAIGELARPRLVDHHRNSTEPLARLADNSTLDLTLAVLAQGPRHGSQHQHNKG